MATAVHVAAGAALGVLWTLMGLQFLCTRHARLTPDAPLPYAHARCTAQPLVHH